MPMRRSGQVTSPVKVRLKDLITSGVQWIERKGIDAVEVPNYVRVFVTSNSDWVVPAGLEERRFCVIDVAESHMQDKAYFSAIMDQMNNGGYEALLQHLIDLPARRDRHSHGSANRCTH